MFPNLVEINRNIAIYGNLTIDTNVDDHVFALNATTGQRVGAKWPWVSG